MSEAQQWKRLFNALRKAHARCTREDRRLALCDAINEARTQLYLTSIPLPKDPTFGGVK